MGIASLVPVLALLQGATSVKSSQPLRPVEAVATASRAPAPSPRVDGKLDEAAWGRATPNGGFIQRDPEEGAPASERTEVRVLYDDEALYVGVRAWDRNAALITAPLARRDEKPASDWIGVLIDSYFDRRTAFEFVINPAGVKQDVYHFNDGEMDPTWDAIWQVGTSRDAEGWTAEFRIPWSQLRFGKGPDRRFGFNVWRRINRTGELQHWRLMAKAGEGDASRYGVLTGFDQINPSRRFEVTPYTVVGRSFTPTVAGNPFKTGTTGRATLGADLRYGLTSNITLSAAINPDFGQVEADPAIVNLSGTETFYPEKRPFFTEGSDIFRFRVSPSPWSNEQFFYTRRIGRPPQLSPDDRGGYASQVSETTILGAAKVQGKTPGGWTIGALAALTTEETSDILTPGGGSFRDVVEPRTGYGVARLGRDFRNGRTFVGAFATAVHRDLPGSITQLRSDALAAGLEMTHRFGGNRYVARGSLIASRVSGSPEAMDATARSSVHYFQRPDIGYATLDPDRTSLSGAAGYFEIKKDGGNWLWGAQYGTRTPGLELNDAGYQTAAGRHEEMAWLTRRWQQPGPVFRSAILKVNQWQMWDYDGRATDRGVELIGNTVFKNYGTLNFWTGTQFGGVDNRALRGGPGLTFPSGAWLGGAVSSDQRKPFIVSLSLDHWDHLAGSQHGNVAGASIGWRPSGRLDLSVGPRYESEQLSRQFVASGAVAGTTEYVVGELSQKTVSLATRGNFTFTPNLTFQLYAEPFISSGRYEAFKRVADPRGPTEGGRFDLLGEDRLIRSGNAVAADFNRDGVPDLGLGEPDFTVLSLRSTAVLRWEYRPASTLFLVWQQERGTETADGRFRLGRNLGTMFDAASSNTLLVKLSHWLSIRR